MISRLHFSCDSNDDGSIATLGRVLLEEQIITWDVREDKDVEDYF